MIIHSKYVVEEKKKMNKKRFLSFILSFALVLTGLGVFPPDTYIKADADSTIVIACSDFQHKQGNTAGQEVVRTLFDSIANEGYEDAQGFLCCGDYDYEYTETEQGVTVLSNVVKEYYGNDVDFALAQGNHDSVPIGTAGMSPSGNNDTDNYGVFVINEDDYMWYNNDEARVKQTAENLRKYLYGKRKAKYTKPIFVVSHLPLHYSMRTRNDGDGQFANYLFDELNDAGANGLNIIFLFGHNHSHGWDDYLGGAAIYQEKGKEILIADGTRNNYTRETLEFTYMNAGYIGYYYGNENERNAGADDTLTMTVFDIRDDKVIVSRIDEYGLYNLKSVGVSNESENHRETELGGYSPYTNIVESPAEIVLNKEIIQPESAPAADPNATPEPGENTGEGGFVYGDCDHPRSHIIDIKEAACEEKGYSGDEVCTNCGDVLEAGKGTDALGHDWNEGVVTTPASQTAEGVKTFTCKRCSAAKTEAIAKLPANEGSSEKDPSKQENPNLEVKAPKITSAKNTAKKTVVVKWKKNAEAKGYQIWYSAKKNFKGKKVLNVKKGKTVKVKIKKLKKKTYYFKIRAIVEVDGKEITSPWSKVKKVKVKK